jgi:hypothetical protein
MPYERIFGPNGWCVAERPDGDHRWVHPEAGASQGRRWGVGAASCAQDRGAATATADSSAVRCRCPCHYDGADGELCEAPTEMYCVNQCAGHGSCYYGFCKCHDGWYGADCSRKKAGMDMEQGGRPGAGAPQRACGAEGRCRHRAPREQLQGAACPEHPLAPPYPTSCRRARDRRPPLAGTLRGDAHGGAAGAAAGRQAQAPLHLRVRHAARLHQPHAAVQVRRAVRALLVGLAAHASCAACSQQPAVASRRHGKTACTWRMWTADAVANHSAIQFSTYAIEALMHEMMLQSPHRWASAGVWRSSHQQSSSRADAASSACMRSMLLVCCSGRSMLLRVWPACLACLWRVLRNHHPLDSAALCPPL